MDKDAYQFITELQEHVERQVDLMGPEYGLNFENIKTVKATFSAAFDQIRLLVS